MNTQTLGKIEKTYEKKVPVLKPGDIVRVHQKIKEGNKERIQVFEGVVLKIKGGGLRTTFTVRKISFGIGVERNYLLHSPNLAKIEIKKRSKVRRAYLTYLRNLSGKSARLKDKQFDVLAVNVKDEPKEPEMAEVTKGDSPTDADITELDAEEIEEPTTDEPIEEVIKAENKEAAKDGGEDEYLDQAESGDNEAEVEGERFAEGIDKSDTDEETGKAREGMQAEAQAEELTSEEIGDEIKQDVESDNV